MIDDSLSNDPRGDNQTKNSNQDTKLREIPVASIKLYLTSVTGGSMPSIHANVENTTVLYYQTETVPFHSVDFV